MKSSIVQKTARIAFVILLAALCVLFACACRGDPVSISNLTLEGEILPGVELHAMAFLLGGEKEVARYLDVQSVLEVIEGQDVATADGTKIRIADTAKAGDVFKVAMTIKDLRFEKEFTVAASEVATVQVLCSNNVEAGETITLSARIYPEGASSREPTYYLVSGEATVEGNELKIDPNADQGEVVVKAVLEGVESPNKRVQISTVQTRSLSWDAPESLRVLPGETILCRAVKYPENSSFGVSISFEKGADAVDYDEGSGFLRIKESAEIPSEIRLVARSGNKEARLALRVAYPDVAAIVTQGSGSVAPGAERSFSFSVEPEDADPSSVRISVVQGNDCIEWTGGASFRVNANASQGEEITFLLTAGEVYRTVSFVVESRVLSSLTIATTGSTDYLKSGESLTFTHVAEPVENDGIVNYRAKVGADLVTIEGETVTVKEGAGIGRVVVVAEGADGTISNEIEFTVSGKYDRRVYSSWSNVGLSPTGEQSCVWMVLPNALNAGVMTVLVPADVVDLVIEGRYEGGDETAYKDVYFYFRNTAERSVTLWNFGVIATQGLGGTVMDFGSSGTTELRLWGQNLVRADSPYLIDNSEEDKDGVWDVGASYSSYESLTLLRRSGKYGYRGAAGGTAISGYALNFTGEGTLEAVAGSGANGTAGGKGANALYGEGIATYLSGAGGDGGHGGDSGAAIYAYSVRFGSGLVTALPGNAGRGAAGGAAGSLDALAGKDVTAISGGAGTRGNDGVCYPAIRATQISGENYLSSLGSLQSRETTFDGSLVEFAEKLSRFYCVKIKYGEGADSTPSGYKMTKQTDASALLDQMRFLMYTMSMMPKNIWRELSFRSGRTVVISLCKSMKSSSSNVLGLTTSTNGVWFATFDTEVRGAYYGGYFNIMLHEFTHVLHYNFAKFARGNFESALKASNLGLDYKTSYGAKDGVYGVMAEYDETNSCFLSAYSRKNVMEDAAETLSMPAAFLSLEPPLTDGVPIRKKYDLLVRAFASEYETLSAFNTGKTLFAYPHLFD